MLPFSGTLVHSEKCGKIGEIAQVFSRMALLWASPPAV
jgi:hypothetical protein